MEHDSSGQQETELGHAASAVEAAIRGGRLLHYGQGKWHPGESLPRWSLGCWWRPDGEAIWRDDRLIADETVDHGHRDAEAKRFITALAERLDVNGECILPLAKTFGITCGKSGGFLPTSIR